MTRVLCTGDWQLGVRTVDLDDQETVAHRIVDAAIERDVELVLHGGDLFEGPQVTPEQLRAFRRPLSRLRDAGIPVLAITGNGRHDAAMRDATGLDIFEDVPGITVATRPGVFDLGDVMVGCLPWVSPSRLVAARGGGDRDRIHADVAEMLVQIARGLREDCGTGRPAILLAHWAVSGASLPTGLGTDVLREPVIPLTDLATIGYDAVVLSHIHIPQTLAGSLNESVPDEVRGQPIFYTGPPQPQNHGDTSPEYGVWLLDLRTHGTSAVFIPIKSRRFVTIDYDVTGLDGDPHNAIVDLVEATRIVGAIVKLRYRATAEQARRIDPGVLRAILLEDGAHAARVEPNIVREQRARVEVADVEQLDELDWLREWAAANELTSERAAAMRDRLTTYIETAR